MTGLRLGYVAVKDPALRDRMKKVLFFTASNVSSVVQYGGIGALEGSQDCIEAFRTELQARRDLFYDGIARHAGRHPQRHAAAGRVLRVPADRSVVAAVGRPATGSVSWAMAQDLISRGRIGCVPGADFGANGEGYIRFCFARDRRELTGALESLGSLGIGSRLWL